MNALEIQAKAARAIRSRRRSVAAAVVAIAETAAHDELIQLLLDVLPEPARAECLAELERQDESLIDAVAFRGGEEEA